MGTGFLSKVMKIFLNWIVVTVVQPGEHVKTH